MSFRKFLLLVAAITLTGCQSPSLSNSKATVIYAAHERQDRANLEARGTHFAVATQGRFATQAAQEILNKGGNLIDAAVAASFVLAVERPQSTGIGGGGFLLYHDAKSGHNYAVDFRERAPLRAAPDMFLDQNGRPDKNKSRNGIFAAGVPGLVAGLFEIHKRFGWLPWPQLLQPAIRLAKQGFAIYPQLAAGLQRRASVLKLDSAARAIFLNRDGLPKKTGDLLVQVDLAKTLQRIARHGENGFYRGPIAKRIVELFARKGGLITLDDLRAYRVKWLTPVHGTFHGFDIYSMPPPSSGGVHVIQFLNFLENDPLAKYGMYSATSLHLEAAALQSSFADRARYLGDPAFVKVPVKGLISKAYARQRRSEVSLDHARRADQVAPGRPLPYESSETTHLSLVDSKGNAISSTQTINGALGAGLVVPGTGIVLNNEMDDFAARVGARNMYGAVGGTPNLIAPQKTPLSSMSPTIVAQNGRPILAVGAPGGTRIISCVAQTIMNVLEYHLSLFDAVATIRYHDQWQPDILTLEPPGPGERVVEKLKKMGYSVQLKQIGCKVMAVERENSEFHAVSDPRDVGTSAAE